MTPSVLGFARAARAVLLTLSLAPAVALAQAPAVGVLTLRSTEFRPEARFTGRVEAVDSVEIIARVTGFVEARGFREGQTVGVGDLLYSIERAPYEATLAQVEAEVARAEAAVTLADLDFARKRELVGREAVAQAQLDESTAKRDEARAALLSAQARRKRAELDLAYTEITAPIAGRIGLTAASVGDLVGPEAGTLARIVAQDPAYVVFPVTQRELLATRASAESGGVSASEVEVAVELVDGSTYPALGAIDFVDVAMDPGTDTVRVRAAFPNPDGALVDGMLVTAVVRLGAAEPALLAPTRAVMVDQTGRYVLVVDAEGSAQVRRVETGATRGAEVIVRSGLSEGDRLIVDGLQRVRPGQPVDAAEIAGN
ncbi:efflux RND transporter periplasmic adaptor subunit [Rubrimonas sp.]|uniref:efflux RND transporter periplasmic adaptor subunit n=1 Tax=Rubrimonas sp. TaxID=2036015 RepID=UPI002FDD230E